MSVKPEIDPLITCAYPKKGPWSPADIDDIAAHNFNGVIFCLEEADVLSPWRELEPAVQRAAAHGMTRWASIWSFGDWLGGEGRSISQTWRQPPCLNNPKFRTLLVDGIDLASQLASTLFIDEPNLSKDKNLNKCGCCEGKEREFTEQLCRYAGRRGLERAVCFMANDRYLGIMEELAAQKLIEWAVSDPYYSPNFPGTGTMPDGRPDTYDNYIGGTARRLAEIALRHPSVRAMTFAQNFHLPIPRDESREWERIAQHYPWAEVPRKVAAASARAGVPNIGVWAHAACRDYAKLAPYDPDAVWENNTLILPAVLENYRPAAYNEEVA